MQGTNQLVRSNWGLGVLLRDTSTRPGWDRTGNPPTARRQLLPPEPLSCRNKVNWFTQIYPHSGGRGLLFLHRFTLKMVLCWQYRKRKRQAWNVMGASVNLWNWLQRSHLPFMHHIINKTTGLFNNPWWHVTRLAAPVSHGEPLDMSCDRQKSRVECLTGTFSFKRHVTWQSTSNPWGKGHMTRPGWNIAASWKSL